MHHAVRLRRQVHHQPCRLASLRSLSFTADAADLMVGTVHVFDQSDGSIALSFATATGTINVVMPSRLAGQMADGVQQLLRQRHGDQHSIADRT